MSELEPEGQEAKQEEQEKILFEGFIPPTRNWFPMPNQWIDICARIDNLAELKVVQYILRHTWGYHEYDGKPKPITVDEFMHGRKKNEGKERIDAGTGLKSDRSVKDGIKAALEHHYIICVVDDSDKGRIKKSYALNMFQAETGVDPTPPTEQENRGVETTPPSGRNYPSGSQNLPPHQVESTPRTEKNTRKDTSERHSRKTSPASKGNVTQPALLPVVKVTPPSQEKAIPSSLPPGPLSIHPDEPEVKPPTSNDIKQEVKDREQKIWAKADELMGGSAPRGKFAVADITVTAQSSAPLETVFQVMTTLAGQGKLDLSKLSTAVAAQVMQQNVQRSSTPTSSTKGSPGAQPLDMDEVRRRSEVNIAKMRERDALRRQAKMAAAQ